MKKIIVSGIQPTGNLHLGNYLGAIKQWKELQENPEYECRFGIMDLHAMTTANLHYESELLTEETLKTLECLNKLGIKKAYVQSQTNCNAVLRMFWFLSCSTSFGQLNRMTQFKEKSDKGNENLGLFSYPVLMAADILALEADLVPVGEDQKQHLELARDLAKKLGLKVPEPLISKSCGRIMSLTDPVKKMSKSDPNDNSRINLNDSAEEIEKKINKAVTSEEGCANLEKIYLGCGGKEGILNWDNARHAKVIVAEQIIEELNAK